MFRNLSISTKLLITMVPLVFLAIGLSAYLNNLYQEKEMLNQARSAAQTNADLIRESLVDMMVTKYKIDDEYLERLNSIRDIHDVEIYFLLDSLRLNLTYQSEERTRRLTERQRLMPANADVIGVFRTGESLWKRRDNIYNTVIPFLATPKCMKCHDVQEGAVLGAITMDISIDRIEAAIRNNWGRSFIIFLVFTAAGIFATVLLYQLLIAKRLSNLVEATKAIGSGNLDKPLHDFSSRDELGELRIAIETMRQQLKNAQAKLIHGERLSMIGQMASSIIHDFRTPMSTINLAVANLQQGQDVGREKMELWYGMIRDSVQKMITMAQELLEFSRGEATLNKQEHSVPEFVDLITRSVSLHLEQAHIRLTVEQEYGGKCVFDMDRFHRALVNIITNAQDAMSNGGELRISSSFRNGYVCFTISDTGQGIPAEIKDKIFDAFVTKGKKKGTGLGLAITKRIIDQHGGMIDVKSEAGRGTTFEVMIPA